MIALIITLAITIIGIVILIIDPCNLIIECVGLVSALVGTVEVLCMIVAIIFAHVGVDVRIEENKIEYDSLCERYEIITSEYEDVSKSDVIKDIAEWNVRVHNYKYWAYNPWTSCFYSKRTADEMKMIER